jgi:hypothetical protein
MHAGYLSLNCGSCHKQEQDVRDALGCNPNMAGNQPAWELVEEDRCTRFMNCPSYFIPEWVWNFWDVYKGYQRSRYQMPRFDEQPRKYVKACDLYESSLGRFQMMKAEDDRVMSQMRGLKRV